MTTAIARPHVAVGLHRATAACLLLALTSGTINLAAQEASTVTTDASNVQPFVLETTFLIVKVDPTRLKLPDLNSVVDPMSVEAKAAIRQTYQRADQGLKIIRELVDNQPIYATVGVPFSQDRQPVFAFVRTSERLQTERLMAFLKQQMRAEGRVEGDYVIAHPLGYADDFGSATATRLPREELLPALKAVEKYPAQMLLLPPAYWRRMMRELPFELPKQVGGGPSSLLIEGVQWAALGIDPAALRTELVIQSNSDVAARNLADHLPKMLRSVSDSISEEMNEQFPAELSNSLVDLFKPQVDGSRITVRVDGYEKNSANLKLLAIASKIFEDKSRRHRNSNRFKQILLSMHNYHDANKSFPPDDKYRGKDGQHHLSWRVHILPYVGEIKLYGQFHLDEPWDSPHNIKLLEKMPDAFTSDAIGAPPDARIKPGYTTFLAPMGEDTAFGQEEASTFAHFLDGTSNTVVLVEVKPEKAVPWTAPDDYVFDPKEPAAGVLISPDGRWLCGFADGSVQLLRSDISAELMLRLFRKSDGNPIDYNKIR